MAHIVIVGNPPFFQGGAGPKVGRAIVTLQEAGHCVRAICPIDVNQQAWRKAFPKRYPDVPVAWYDMPVRQNSFANIPMDELAQQTRGVRDALCHFHSVEPVDLVYLFRESVVWDLPAFARAHDIRCVASLSGNLLAMMNGHIPGANAERWLSEYSETDLAISCADHMTRSLRAAGLSNLITLRNGVDVAGFRPQLRPPSLAARYGLTDDDLVVMHASNLKPIKRPLDIVSAFAVALEREPRLILLIAGEGVMEADIRSAIKNLGIASRVRFLGWIDNTTMADHYALADVTVLASDSEGLSMSCLESMACARPVIASDIAASREIIADGVNGLLFPLGDIQALADTMVAVARDPDGRHRLGATARHTVATRFTRTRMERRRKEIVEGLLVSTTATI